MLSKERKYISQMTDGEAIYCHARAILATDYLSMVKHANDRYSERHLYFNPADIKRMVSYGRVVEYERCYFAPEVTYVGAENLPVTLPAHSDERIVIRSHYQATQDITIVLDVTNNRVITLWLNKLWEHAEQKYRLGQYNQNLKIY